MWLGWMILLIGLAATAISQRHSSWLLARRGRCPEAIAFAVPVGVVTGAAENPRQESRPSRCGCGILPAAKIQRLFCNLDEVFAFHPSTLSQEARPSRLFGACGRHPHGVNLESVQPGSHRGVGFAKLPSFGFAVNFENGKPE